MFEEKAVVAYFTNSSTLNIQPIFRYKLQNEIKILYTDGLYNRNWKGMRRKW
jgi:hypothetical protein